MPYHPHVVAQVKALPMSNLGAKLGRWLIWYDLPVTKIALATGATRQSVYNWMKGGEIFVAYKPYVERIIELLEQARADKKTAEEAWSLICGEFNIKA